MTVDSEAIFALVDELGTRRTTLEQLVGSMAAAWVDEREPDVLHVARGIGRPLWIARGRREVLFASTRAALEVVEGTLRLDVPQDTRSRRAGSSRSSTASWRRSSASSPDRSYREDAPAAGRPRAARGRSCLERLAIAHRLGVAASALRASRRARPRRPPRAAARARGTGTPTTRRLHVDHAGRPATPTAASRRAVAPPSSPPSSGGGRAPARAPHPVRDRALEPLLADRHVEAGLAERRASDPNVCQISDFDAMRPRFASRSCAVGVRPSSSPSSRSCCEQLLAADEAPRRKARGPLGGVPGAEVLDHRLRVHAASGSAANSRIVGERPSRSARRAQLLEDLLVGVAPSEAGAKLCERCSSIPARAGCATPRPGHAIILDHSVKICKRPEQPDARAVGSLRDESPPRRRDLGRPPRRRGSRAPPGAAAARRCPASSSGSSIPARSTRSPRGCPHGVALVSATNGKTTTTAMARAILSPPRRLAWNNSGANLASGVASTLLSARGRGARPARGRRVRAARGDAPRRGRASSPSATSSATSSTATASSSTSPSGGATPWPALPADDDARRQRRRPARRRPRGRPRRARCASASTIRVTRAPALQHAADSKYCVRCGAPYALRRRLRRPSRRLPLPELRPRTARRSTSPRARSTRRASTARASRSRRPRATRASQLALPGLYNVYNALAAASLCARAGRAADEIVAGLERFRAAFGRFERFAAGDRSVLLLLIKNPAGANEACGRSRTAASRRRSWSRSTTAIADGRDVSWIWDVDFEPLLARAERIVATRRAGRRARSPLHLRRLRRESGSRSSPRSRRRSTAGSR